MKSSFTGELCELSKFYWILKTNSALRQIIQIAKFHQPGKNLSCDTDFTLQD